MRQPEDVGFRHGWLFAPSREAPGMPVVCLGGACIDRNYHLRGAIEWRSSNPAEHTDGFGGVARNVAENLGRLGARVLLVSVVGNDVAGATLLRQLEKANVDRTLVKTVDAATDEYVAILERGELAVGAADFRALEAFTLADLDERWEIIARADWLFVDCNVSAEVLQACIQRRGIARYKLAVDAVSIPKARNLPENVSAIDLLLMNEAEARAYLSEAPREGEQLVTALGARGAGCVVLSLGARGVVCADGNRIVSIPAQTARLVNATGAGDALCAGTLWRLLQGDDLFDAARFGVALAAQTVESDNSVMVSSPE